MARRKPKVGNIVYYDDEKITITRYTNGVYKVEEKETKKVVSEHGTLKGARRSIGLIPTPPIESIETKPKKKKAAKPKKAE